ncbi:MAG TPA: ABC transporter ATP-binding protein, partial [Burkholderiaceae bacterium]|nr:ABC transporter ATP-binding protein [Burkholderiaceae bacterium]
MSTIELIGVSKRYGDMTAVEPTDLKIEQGELVTLLGPSGSGKSTILSMIAGLTKPSTGFIKIGGRDVTHVRPSQRNLGVVFQSYALFPHMSVFDNVAFPLTVRGLRKADIAQRVGKALEQVRLSGLQERRPSQLSGGQQQRVALARALVFEPDILLLDEPMGALDKKLREEVQLELRQLQRELGVTTVLVTHDQEEALSLSTRLVVLDHGRVQQVDTPMGAYRRPANRFVAGFIGTANVFDGQLQT